MKKAKKVLVFLMVLTFTLSVSLSAFAASDKSGNGQAKGKAKHSTESTIVSEPTATEPVTSETTAPAAWTVKKANKNLVQFQSTDKKGGKIVIPLRAMESHGIEAVWDETKQTVTLSGTNGKSISIGVNGINTPLSLTAAAASSTSPQPAASITIAPLDAITPDPNGEFKAEVTGAIGEIPALKGTITGKLLDDGNIEGTFSGTVVDPILGIMNVSGCVAGTPDNPEISIDTQTQSLSSLAGGHAYVPFKWLSAYFGTVAPAETAAAATTVTDETTVENSEGAVIADDDAEADEGTDADAGE